MGKFTFNTMIENERNKEISKKIVEYILPIVEESKKQLAEAILEDVYFCGSVKNEDYKKLSNVKECLKNNYNKVMNEDINDILELMGSDFNERRYIMENIEKIIKENI